MSFNADYSGRNTYLYRWLDKKYKIVSAANDRPLYIYTVTIKSTSSDETNVKRRVRSMVIKKASEEWVEDNQNYTIGAASSRLYTQFVVGDAERVGSQSVREVTIPLTRFKYSSYTVEQKSYRVTFELLREPFMINRKKMAIDIEIQRAIHHLLLADVSKDDSFYSAQYKDNNGEIFIWERVKPDTLRPWLGICRGLKSSIKEIKEIGEIGEIGEIRRELSLMLKEEVKYFLQPFNMIDLLTTRFGFDVSGRLDSGQIESLERDLTNVAVVMKLKRGSLNGGDDELPNVYRGRIHKISYEEWGEGNFKRDYPDEELEFADLPYLIDEEGKRMPMELCSIERGHPAPNMKIGLKDKYDPDQLNSRTGIFETNCTELIADHISIFKQFGFALIEYGCGSDEDDWRKSRRS